MRPTCQNCEWILLAVSSFYLQPDKLVFDRHSQLGLAHNFLSFNLIKRVKPCGENNQLMVTKI
jgi:hypothetical protein